MTVWKKLLVVPFGLFLLVIGAGMVFLACVVGPFALAAQMLEGKK